MHASFNCATDCSRKTISIDLEWNVTEKKIQRNFPLALLNTGLMCENFISLYQNWNVTVSELCIYVSTRSYLVCHILKERTEIWFFGHDNLFLHLSTSIGAIFSQIWPRYTPKPPNVGQCSSLDGHGRLCYAFWKWMPTNLRLGLFIWVRVLIKIVRTNSTRLMYKWISLPCG